MTPEGVLESWPVESITDLVNSLYTLDGETIESWPDIEAYRSYLRRNGRDAEASSVVAKDLPRVRALRARLRQVLAAPVADRLAVVDALLVEHVRGLRLGAPEGWTAMTPVSVDDSHAAMIAARSAHVLAVLAEAGELGRLKLCSFEGCDGALLDRTRPGTQRFCCPRCAARVASAAYRQRRRNRTARTVLAGARPHQR